MTLGPTTVTYEPIGMAHSPFRETRGMPIQPTGAASAHGEVRIFPKYAAALEGLEAFSHIILIYHFHRAGRAELTVVPFLDSEPHGVFCTRAPARPNPIGLSVLRLCARNGNDLQVTGMDMLDGTPVLDIKPYVPEFDRCWPGRIGWYAKAKGRADSAQSDDRFR